MSGRIATVGSAVATLGLIGAIIYYGSQPDYGVLFADLKPADAQAIVEKLQTANVPYSVTNGGTTVQVPHERISELRLQMAGEGALSGGHVGFDLFDKTSFGATDFAQQVNYRRAIEGELAKTLEGMDEVESARVHITPKKDSVFADKEEGAKASVMLKVRQNKELSGERSEAIVSLVSSSIEGLDPSRVSVMDTRGRLLVAAGSGRTDLSNGAGAFHAQLEAKQKYEAENAARIITLLEPVVGENKVRADISADLDFSHREQSEEKYNPQSQVVRSQQTSTEARNSSTSQTGGVAGARSNNPATQTPPVQPAPVTSGDQRNTSTVNYEIDKTVTKTIGGGGRVNRMTVSVVVDHKNVNDVEVARSSEELRQIQDLVAAAVGINAERGDSVVVQTMPFNKLPVDEAAAAPFLEKNKQIVLSLTKYGALVIAAVLLLLFAIRPALKGLKEAARAAEGQNLLGDGAQGERRGLALQAGGADLSQGTEMKSMMTVGELQAQMSGGYDPRLAQNADRVETMRKQLVEQTMTDTDMVVSTMRGWLAEKA